MHEIIQLYEVSKTYFFDYREHILKRYNFNEYILCRIHESTEVKGSMIAQYLEDIAPYYNYFGYDTYRNHNLYI
jgi:hypothetical protein